MSDQTSKLLSELPLYFSTVFELMTAVVYEKQESITGHPYFVIRVRVNDYRGYNFYRAFKSRIMNDLTHVAECLHVQRFSLRIRDGRSYKSRFDKDNRLLFIADEGVGCVVVKVEKGVYVNETVWWPKT